MKTLNSKTAILVAVLGALSSPAFAAISFGNWSWRLLDKQNTQPLSLITQIPLPKNGYLKGRLKAVLVVVNQGESREGILLRYALSADVYSVADPKKYHGWTIPFAVDERRVPILKSGQSLPVVFDVTDSVKDYFKSLALEGWRPGKIKMEVMVEPRQGEDSALKTTQSVLNVAEKTPELETRQ